MEQLAIIGPTASGKSALAIEVALKKDAYILSIDSLAIYKEADIVSAKPSKEELASVRHFGIDELFINEYFSVEIFIGLYERVVRQCKEDNRSLVIVGGTSFYLKSLLEGLSVVPSLNEEQQRNLQQRLADPQAAYAFLKAKDPHYMGRIEPNDRYRIEKALHIYEATGMAPSEWFKANPPRPVIKELDIYEIAVEKDVLRRRIEKRTQVMLQAGLIDEVCALEQKYTREPNPMKAIGIKETLAYLDGKVDRRELEELITVHTAQLAKRQRTFNRSQFKKKESMEFERLRAKLLS